ncbi:MAG: 50S ribosomal protein L11 methyltransferase [Ruminococcus sp.]|nr:50S ribosomal protein L11 methyltransferase [Ruminococcus sp.]
MAEWTEIKISVDSKDIDKAGDIANMVVPYGIYIEDYSELEQEVQEIAHIDLIDEDLLAKNRNEAFLHIYLEPDVNPSEALAFLSERYTAEGIKHKLDTSATMDEDWRNNWKKFFNPTPIGEKLLIRPTWRDDFDANGRVVLNIDPGLAFGTGNHETTRLCLETIEKYLSPDDTVLDVGCGSGILAIASLLLGAKSAVGVDIDEVAVRTAEENAELNKVNKKFTAIVGDLTQKVSGKYNLIVANIVADAIISLSKGVKEFMNPDTVYIMSGIIDTRGDEVAEKISRDFDIIERYEDGGWVCLAAKLKQ